LVRGNLEKVFAPTQDLQCRRIEGEMRDFQRAVRVLVELRAKCRIADEAVNDLR
jgi:hypothetical protein